MLESIINGMAEILEMPGCKPDTNLIDSGKWDSMAVVAAMALLDEHGIDADPDRLALCVTVGDIAELQ